MQKNLFLDNFVGWRTSDGAAPLKTTIFLMSKTD